MKIHVNMSQPNECVKYYPLAGSGLLLALQSLHLVALVQSYGNSRLGHVFLLRMKKDGGEWTSAFWAWAWITTTTEYDSDAILYTILIILLIVTVLVQHNGKGRERGLAAARWLRAAPPHG